MPSQIVRVGCVMCFRMYVCECIFPSKFIYSRIVCLLYALNIELEKDIGLNKTIKLRTFDNQRRMNRKVSKWEDGIKSERERGNWTKEQKLKNERRRDNQRYWKRENFMGQHTLKFILREDEEKHKTKTIDEAEHRQHIEWQQNMNEPLSTDGEKTNNQQPCAITNDTSFCFPRSDSILCDQ